VAGHVAKKGSEWGRGKQKGSSIAENIVKTTLASVHNNGCNGGTCTGPSPPAEPPFPSRPSSSGICGRVFDTNFADDMFNTQSCVLKFAHPYCCTMELEPRLHVVLNICSQHVFRVATATLYAVCDWVWVAHLGTFKA